MKKEELKRVIWIYNKLIERYPFVYEILKKEYEKWQN
jgi:hypothetical protein